MTPTRWWGNDNDIATGSGPGSSWVECSHCRQQVLALPPHVTIDWSYE